MSDLIDVISNAGELTPDFGVFSEWSGSEVHARDQRTEEYFHWEAREHSLLFQMFMFLLIQTERYFDWSFSHDRFSFQFIRGYRGIASPNKRIWTAKCYACEFSFCIAVSFL
nr:MAG TPA: hypothetical protein [Caudoviricetes sp.]